MEQSHKAKEKSPPRAHSLHSRPRSKDLKHGVPCPNALLLLPDVCRVHPPEGTLSHQCAQLEPCGVTLVRNMWVHSPQCPLLQGRPLAVLGRARGADKWGGCVLRAGSVLLPRMSLNPKEPESSKCEPSLETRYTCVCLSKWEDRTHFIEQFLN